MDRPILKLDAPRLGERVKRQTGRPYATPPSSSTRGTGVPPKFDRLASVIGDGQAPLSITTNPDEIAPERAIVFEVTGTIQNFATAVKHVQGLEFLFDQDEQYSPTEEFHYLNEDGSSDLATPLNGCLYMVMPDVQALREILSLWRRYQAGEPFRRGQTGWKHVFDNLRDLRPWGHRDRVLPETKATLVELVEIAPHQPIKCEVELWFRREERHRAAAYGALSEMVAASGGTILDQSCIPEIAYHAALVSLPPAVALAIVEDGTTGIGAMNEVMYVRPQSVAQFPLDVEREDVAGTSLTTDAGDENVAEIIQNPIIAVLDGVPIQNHALLRDRLIVEDPDNLEAVTPVMARSHGTAMASFILHGDRNTTGEVLNERIFMHPVMLGEAHPFRANEWIERMSSDRLPIDVIYRAVRRIKEGEGTTPALAPDALIFNHSVADESKPFSGRISPWARLLDFLSYKYKILFIAAAGNIGSELKVDGFATQTAFEAITPEERTRHIIQAIDRAKTIRTLLSPSEAMNIVTVGGWHNDNHPGGVGAAAVFDPFPLKNFTNMTSAIGLGFNRSIKPDIVYDGGKEHLIPVMRDDGLYLRSAKAGRLFGQRAAAPDFGAAGLLNVEQNISGTSNATALMTRGAARIYRAFEEASNGQFEAFLPPHYRAVVVKTMLMHSCAWGEHGQIIHDVIGPAEATKFVMRTENAARYLGNGYPNIDRVVECAKNRATFFRYGQLSTDQAHEYEIDLPPSLEGKLELRKVTITCGWLTPVNPKHQGYRNAALEVSATGDDRFSLGVDRITGQPNHHAVRRGTSFHVVHEGKDAVPYVDGGKLKFSVACRATAGRLEHAVPYGVAITIEVAETSAIDVYQEIQTIIQDRIRSRTRARAS